jgi:hypothetical protein
LNTIDRLISFIRASLPGAGELNYWETLEADSVCQVFNPASSPLHGFLIPPPLQRMASSKIPIAWFSYFDLTPPEDISLSANVFDESEKTMLAVLLPSPDIALKSSLLLVHFGQNISTFGISAWQKTLTPEMKNIIGHIFSNSLQAFWIDVNQREKERKEHAALLGKMLEETDFMRIGLQNKVEAASLFYREYVDMVLNKLAGPTAHLISFSDAAWNKILASKSRPEQLENIIDKALQLCRITGLLEGKLQVVIREEMIILSDDNNTETQPTSQQTIANECRIGSRYDKTILLLDRLEWAAAKIKNAGISMTGKMVGQHMEMPVSAPAISDSLKKHRNKILHLFRRYPEQWPVIRQEFRPIRNLMENNQQDQIMTA